MTALIVIFFDISLAFACFFGIGTIVERHEKLQMAVLLIGSLVVVYIGIDLLKFKLKDNDTEEKDEVHNIPIKKIISTACIVTWFNPQAIIDGTMMLGAFRASLLGESSNFFISGVCLASCLWFLTLTTVISFIKEKLSSKVIRRVNAVCGIIIVFYGAKLLYNFFTML